MRLALDGVGHAFLGRPVFEDLRLSVAEGEIVALLGPSGCGKTTVLQIAAGLIDPLRGRVRRAWRRHAVVFQEPRLLPWMTVLMADPSAADDVGLRRALQDLVTAAAAREHFSALFVTHDLAEAVRIAHRLVVLTARGNLVTARPIAGRPGVRSDRDIFAIVEGWSADPAFAELMDGARAGAA